MRVDGTIEGGDLLWTLDRYNFDWKTPTKAYRLIVKNGHYNIGDRTQLFLRNFNFIRHNIMTNPV